MEFNLQTSYGQAQAYAHSAEGAARVKQFEAYEATVHEQVAEQLDQDVHEFIRIAEETLEELQDQECAEEFAAFKKKLSVSDRRWFNKIAKLQALREKRIEENMNLIQSTAANIKLYFGML